MTHMPSPAALSREPPTSQTLPPPLIGTSHQPHAALADKRAAVASLQRAWVAAAEAHTAVGRGRAYMPRIMQLMDEIADIERLLALRSEPTTHTVWGES